MGALTLSADLDGRRGRNGRLAQRLAVAWQHPAYRWITPVGLLTCSDAGYRFDYLRRAADVPDFQPFLGFDELGRAYTSERLFPLFAQRVMRPSRPDFASYANLLALDTETDEWSILARSQGQREGDGIRVYAEPTTDERGLSEATFFVSGIRHRLATDPAVATALASVREGDELIMVEDACNEVDGRALLVSERSGVTVAWIPNVLLPHAHVVASSADLRLQVAAIRGVEVPPAYRLLVQLRGSVPAGYRAFDGPEWVLATRHSPKR